ncbi:MAG: mannose-6-phosphate isomerase, class I [Buchananella hordeovulneris]|nr:mannose-6-phosphate isomerase, class I [Buchananella hordeovulneris]
MQEQPSPLLALHGAVQHYSWGSPSAIPAFLGKAEDGKPYAEVWFGTHPRGATRVEAVRPEDEDNSGGAGRTLAAHILTTTRTSLGEAVQNQFGPRLPYLLKLIAPAGPLSLQVHPTRERAAQGYSEEELRGVPRTHPERSYHDRNHKPEMLLALEHFEALAGFRAPRRAAELLAGLKHPLAAKLRGIIRSRAGATGMRDAFAYLVQPETRPSPADVDRFAHEVCERLAARRSPSERTDRIVKKLARNYPGDPGVVAAMLLNPVTLQPGEALYVPAGTVHAYLEGFGVEIMADSDNVLRGGLTSKHIDVTEMLACVEPTAAPPVRIAPETSGQRTRTYYAPVDDFELCVTPGGEETRIPGGGPRILLCTEGEVHVRVRPSAAFVAANANGNGNGNGNGGSLNSLPAAGESTDDVATCALESQDDCVCATENWGEDPGEEWQADDPARPWTALRLQRGQAAFVAASCGRVRVSGPGTLIQAGVP